MNKQEGKKISIWKTIFVSFWSHFLLLLFFVGSILYSRDMLVANTGNWKEVSFWGIMMLFLVLGFVYLLPKATFYIYRKDAKESKGGERR